MLAPLSFLGGVIFTLLILYVSFLIWRRRTEAVLAAIERRILKPSTDTMSDATDCLARLKISSKELDSIPSQLEGLATQIEEVTQGLTAQIEGLTQGLTTQTEGLTKRLTTQLEGHTAQLNSISVQTDKVSGISNSLSENMNRLQPLLADLLAVQETLNDFHKEGIRVMANRIDPPGISERIVLIFPKDSTIFKKAKKWFGDRKNKVAL